MIVLTNHANVIMLNCRSEGGDGETSVMARVLSTFLNELDGISSLSTPDANSSTDASELESEFNVFVLAASENLQNLDQALLRPGRLSNHVQLGLPTRKDIGDLLRFFSKNLPLSGDVSMDEIVRLCTDRLGGSSGRGGGGTAGPSCAAVSALCREAVQIALRERIQVSGSSSSASAIDLSNCSINQQSDGRVCRSHFISALDSFLPQPDEIEDDDMASPPPSFALSKQPPFQFKFDGSSNMPSVVGGGSNEFKFDGKFSLGEK